MRMKKKIFLHLIPESQLSKHFYFYLFFTEISHAGAHSLHFLLFCLNCPTFIYPSILRTFVCTRTFFVCSTIKSVKFIWHLYTVRTETITAFAHDCTGCGIHDSKTQFVLVREAHRNLIDTINNQQIASENNQKWIARPSVFNLFFIRKT